VTLKAAAFEGDRLVSPIAQTRLDPLSIRHRTSQQLLSCSGKLVLNLEIEPPGKDPGPAFLVDVMNPCWIYAAADLSNAPHLSVSVGQVPFNFQLGADRAKIALHPPATANGELEVRIDHCDGPPVAVMPLPLGKPGAQLHTLTAALPRLKGTHDLCFRFTAAALDPMSVIDWVQLAPDQGVTAAAKAGH
jgi:hexosaminidase